MKLFKKIPFSHEDKQYYIRIMYNDNMINVVAFYNNYPANGFRYQVQIPKQCNVEGVLEKYKVDDLIEIAKNDLNCRKWDKLKDIIQENMILK
ncbi:MAG: hypothetical protein KAR38_16000 [Calditrichia bacterium]|nr:hypothetical protein [Calditrichia bacterium]